MEGGRRIGFMLYGSDSSDRDAFTDDKYSAGATTSPSAEACSRISAVR